MILITSDEKREVNVGQYEIWHCLYSTVAVRLKDFEEKAPLAFRFLQSGECASAEATKTARDINLVRDELSKIPPESAVFDLNDMERETPWKDHLSEVITSCNTMFTTSDGKDLLYEIVSILCYAGVKGVDVTHQ